MTVDLLQTTLPNRHTVSATLLLQSSRARGRSRLLCFTLSLLPTPVQAEAPVHPSQSPVQVHILTDGEGSLLRAKLQSAPQEPSQATALHILLTHSFYTRSFSCWWLCGTGLSSAAFKAKLAQGKNVVHWFSLSDDWRLCVWLCGARSGNSKMPSFTVVLHLSLSLPLCLSLSKRGGCSLGLESIIITSFGYTIIWAPQHHLIFFTEYKHFS